MPVNEPLLNVSAAAEILGVHPDTLKRWSDQGLIPTQRTPTGYRKYRVEDLRYQSPEQHRAQIISQR